MLPDIQHAIRLQILDDRIGVLTKEIATLPRHIAEIEKKLEGHLRRLEHDKAALAANQRDRKRLEGDIQANEQKVSKLKTQMMEAKNNEQYRAFQHEIEFAGHETRKAEDRILELMSEAEPLDKNVKAAEVSLADEKKLVEGDKNAARETTAKHQQEIDTLKADRASIVAAMTPATVSLYERVRKNRANVGITEVVAGRCGRCNIMLRPQYLQDLKKNDKIMTCESCGRILYYNPPQAVEDLGSGGTRVNMSGKDSPASRAS